MYADTILARYTKLINELRPENRFHFVSRLHLLQPSLWTEQQLGIMANWYFNGNSKQNISSKLRLLCNSSPDPIQTNAASIRLPLFERYPCIYGYELQLFFALHAHVQYSRDIQDLLIEPPNIEGLIHTLISNPTTLGVLSTYIVDVFYLYWRFIKHDEKQLIGISAINKALDQTIAHRDAHKLKLYLLTHCIIGESLFYSRSISTLHHQYYVELLKRADQLIETHWSTMTIDTKLELALCHLLMNSYSHIVDRAIKEAEQHYDSGLGYITDPLVMHKNTLSWAEHRNVLYIMCCLLESGKKIS